MMKRESNRLKLSDSYLANFQVAQFNFNKLVAEERLLRRLRRSKLKEKSEVSQ